MIEKILNFFSWKSVDQQEKEYIDKYGYPDEDVIFTDNLGRCSRLIGLNTFKYTIKLGENIKINNK
jgi:hypothetical protein